MRVAALQGPLELGGDYFRWVQASRLHRARPEFHNSAQADNVGDWFVTEIVNRLVDYDELLLVPTHASAAQWDEVNATCDVVLIKGGNFLVPGFLRDQVALEDVRACRLPMVVMGAGVQQVPAGGVPFTPEDVEILRIIHASTHSSSVRGHLTAEVLAGIGIDNAVVTGCPTLFWERRPERPVRTPDPATAGYTFRTWLYSDDDDPYVAQLRGLQLLRRHAAEVRVILQGEEDVLQQLHIARHWGGSHAGTLVWDQALGMNRLVRTPLDADALADEARGQLAPWGAGRDTADWLIDRTFFSWDIADYLELYRSLGLVMGCRLHSNLLSLAQGTPAYFLTYDDRTRELVALLDLPSTDVLAVGDDLDPFAADWSGFEAAYRRQYAVMHGFLEDNGLPHLLPAPATAPAATPAPAGT